MPNTYIVRSGSLSGFMELVELLGGEPISLLEEAGISLSSLKDPDTYIPFLALARVLEKAASVCGRSDFGAQLSLRQGLEVIGALGAQLCLQESIADALLLIKQHMDFHARGCNVTPDYEQGALIMEFAFANQVDCTQLMVLSLGIFKRGVSQLTGYKHAPLQVHLQQEAPASPSSYNDLFEAPIKYGQTENCLYYPLDILLEPVSITPKLREVLNQEWRRSGQRKIPDSLDRQVEHAIFALLPTGDCNQETIARMVGFHPRVLQKRLKQTGHSFSAILSRVRERLAQEKLANSDIALTELSLQLGFNDLAVFSRSFKKWTGVSPSIWREQHKERLEFSSLD